MGGAFPPADRRASDAVAGSVVSLPSRMEHVGIVVDDLAAATALFVELGLKLLSERVVGGSVDSVVGLEGVRTALWPDLARCGPPL